MMHILWLVIAKCRCDWCLSKHWAILLGTDQHLVCTKNSQLGIEGPINPQLCNMHLQYPSLWLTNIAHLGVDHQSASRIMVYGLMLLRGKL